MSAPVWPPHRAGFWHLRSVGCSHHGLSAQGGYGLRSLCTHLATEGVDRDTEAREAPARWRDDQKLRKGRDINRRGKCFWRKNRVKGIHPGVPQTQKATGVASSWVWVNWSGPRGSAKCRHGVCLLPMGLVESGPWVSEGVARPGAVPSGGALCHGGGMAGPADGPGLSGSVSGHPGQ